MLAVSKVSICSGRCAAEPRDGSFFFLHATHSAQLHFFPFWFFVDDAEAMRANYKPPFEPPAQRTCAVMFPDACFTSGNSPGLTRTAHPKKNDNERP
jgi:hypothetical protein